MNQHRKRIITPPGTPVNEIGKLPPQAIELEEAVLGAMLLEKEAFETVVGILYPESFYKEQNGRVFNAILSLYRRKEAVDILTVTQELKRTGELDIVGGSYYVSTLTNRIASSANIEFHARIVAQKHLQRELICIGTQTIKKGFEEATDVFDLIDETKKTIEHLEHKLYQVSQAKNIDVIFDETVTKIDDFKKNGREIQGEETGLKDLDRKSGGLKNEVIMVGGRPGMGKSSFVRSIVKKVALIDKKPCVFFSLEEPADQVVMGLLSNLLEINSWAIRTGNLMDDQWEAIKKAKESFGSNLIIDDTPAITWQYIETRIKKLRKDIPMNIRIVVLIDYVQLMQNTADEVKGQTDEGVHNIRANRLADIAKKYNLCLIELSQLGREVEKLSPPRPQMSHLKNSGAYEANSHQVWLLYRPEYYDKDAKDDKGNDLRGLCEINVAKNRYGSTGFLYTRFIGKYSQFKDYVKDGQIDSANNDAF